MSSPSGEPLRRGAAALAAAALSSRAAASRAGAGPRRQPMPEILSALEQSALGTAVREWPWAFPVLEILHCMGLATLFGALVVVDGRLLGLAPRLPLPSAARFLPLALAGFGVDLATGLLCFTADPLRYFPNVAFRVKMLLVVLAGLNALWFKLAVLGRMAAGETGTPAPAAVRVMAGASLLLWTGVIACGRLIPYLEGL